jgi:hypothetical protein
VSESCTRFITLWQSIQIVRCIYSQNQELQILDRQAPSIVSTMSTDKANIDDPALARKRRMKQRAIQRAEERDDPSFKRQRNDDYGEDDSEECEDVESTSGELAKPSIRGIKQQARYIPGVPMAKQELAAWRKEARRVRNRESAAESRRKTRDRIDELEAEVEGIQSKYAAAVKRIVELEAATSNSHLHHHDSFTPDRMRQDLMETSNSHFVISPSSSVVPSPDLSPEAMPLSPRESFSLDGDDESCHLEQVSQKYQHIMNMISRPTAACVRIT